jgi:CheY-like chemotaxis protein/signal transduction histidine kinase
MAFKEPTIATRLLATFALLLGVSLAGGAMSIHWIDSLAAATSNILEHPFTVSVAIADIRADILANQVALMQLAHGDGPDQIQTLTTSIEAKRGATDLDVAIVRQRYLGNAWDVENMQVALDRYRAVADQAIALARSGQRDLADALVQGEATPLAGSVLDQVGVIINTAASEAEQYRGDARAKAVLAFRTTLAAVLAIGAFGILVAGILIRSIAGSLRTVSRTVVGLVETGKDRVLATEAVAAGDLTRVLQFSQPLHLDLSRLPKDDLGTLMRGIGSLSEIQAALDASFAKMTTSLRRAREEQRLDQWLEAGMLELDTLLRDEQTLAPLAGRVLAYLARYLEAGAGALYIYRERDEELELAATYATSAVRGPGERVKLGQGLLGQAALEGRMIALEQVPGGYLTIGSALGASTPRMVVAMPFAHDGKLVGALELGTFRPFSAIELAFLKQATEALAIGVQVNLSRQRVNELLIQSQSQEEELRLQQEELQQTNEELEERAHLLEQQREQISAKSLELERVSAYKSEFLANMSHELRTPLNSLMILSGILRDNKDGNLSPKQVDYAGTINGAGRDLLDLINDILDLSKIEAGHMEYSLEEAEPEAIALKTGKGFQPLADQKGIDFSARVEPGTPRLFWTDLQRCSQILKNLVANAIKFTAQGSVTLRIFTPQPAENPLQVPAIAFAVADTGIGIPAGKLEAVFQAFQQVDGTTSRKYGGTGLGLSISRQLARGLHGELLLTSVEGAGTVVTLFLPLGAAPMESRPVPRMAEPPLRMPPPQAAPSPRGTSGGPLPPAPIPDDREQLKPGSRSILVIEDDLDFAVGLVEMVRERGFQALTAADGPDGLALAEALQPSAIILDVMLPGLDGWEVMQRLAANLRTRHIPVHFLTCLEDRQKAMAMGAIGFVTKPVSSEELDAVLGTIEAAVTHGVKKLLIVEDDANEALSLVALLTEREIEIQVAATGAEAIRLLTSQPFDCIVLDLGLSDMSGFDLLAHIQKLDENRRIPVIIHSGRDLTREDEQRLQHYAESIIIKGAKSPERLLNEVTLFLHVVETSLPPEKRRMIRQAMDGEAVFDGKKVLIADDDMRNVFSLSSLLSERNMTILEAENGREALLRLQEHPDTRIVLMDIMMPEMDGYQAIRAIRQDPRFARLPIIALTAKAMKGDREACLKAGASDYISKPIDSERLLSLLRVWLYPS